MNKPTPNVVSPQYDFIECRNWLLAEELITQAEFDEYWTHLMGSYCSGNDTSFVLCEDFYDPEFEESGAVLKVANVLFEHFGVEEWEEKVINFYMSW